MKKTLLYSCFLFLSLLTSCKNDQDATTISKDQGVASTPDPNAGKQISSATSIDTSATNLTIPSPCQLISPAEIKSIFNVAADVTFNPSSEGAKADKSCFFRIEDEKPNGAIMIQISTNPLPSEITDYPIKLIEGKMSTGEQNPVDGKPSIYKSLPALGEMGCYNFDMGKYHWQYNKQYLFLIAFNTSHNEKDQKAMAIEVAKIINKNFQSSINTK